jgi:signal transduction histidine kinase/CheY-like chemotaxis protein
MALCGAFALFFLTVYTARMQDQSLQAAAGRAEGIARMLAAAVAPAVDFSDAVSAAQDLERLAGVPGAVHAEVRARDGGLLARWNAPGSTISARRVASGVSVDAERLYVSVPVPTRAGDAGTLVATFTLDQLKQERWQTLRFAVVVSLVVLLCGLLAAFAIGTLVIRPLRRMTTVALRIAHGDLEAQSQLDTHSRDEVGILGRVLDTMITRLKEHNRELEARVEERTSQLVSANSELGDRLRDLHSTQQQLITADRRNSVGLLAAGVAHEINNPITYVAANVRYVSELLDGGETDATTRADMVQALTEANDGCDRVAYIVKSLKTFSRSDEKRDELVDVAKAADSAISMAANEVKHRARLVRDFAEVPPIRGSEVQIAQVVLNLLINAAHAIEQGSADRNEIRVSIAAAGESVRITVSDTGSGIRPDVRARLFTPFFTTKPVGVGTGLGLSICQGIIAGLGGCIEVESELGKGSAFTLTIPAARSEASAPSASPPRAAASRKRLLVVDDDAVVANSIQRVLSNEHEVTVTTSAREGLEKLSREPFDLILCDLMMPDMNGIQFERELRERHPSLGESVLFVSAGAFTPEARAFCEANRERMLDKPIDFDGLRSRLSQIPVRMSSGGRVSSSSGAP